MIIQTFLFLWHDYHAVTHRDHGLRFSPPPPPLLRQTYNPAEFIHLNITELYLPRQQHLLQETMTAVALDTAGRSNFHKPQKCLIIKVD